MRKFTAAGLTWALVGLSAIALRADTLTFTNGDSLTGTLERADAAHCVFHTAMSGEVTVPWANVHELQTVEGFVVLGLTGQRLQGNLDIFDSMIEVTAPGGLGPQFMDRKQMRLIVDPATYARDIVARPHLWQSWRGAASGGFSQVSATQSSISYTTNLDFQRPVPRLSWLPQTSNTLFHFDGAYGKLSQAGQPTVKTSIFDASLEQDQDLNARLFAFANGAFNHNFSQGLELQQAYGGGMGWKLIQTRPTQMDVKADLHWTRQRFLAGTIDSFLASSFTETMRHNYGKLVWTENVSLTPSYTNGLAYQMSGSSIWAVPVYKDISVNFTTVDNYLNNPQPGFLKNSLQISTGLQFTVH